MTKTFREAVLHIKDGKASWCKSYEECQKRDMFVDTNTGQNEVDKKRRIDLADSFRQLKKITDEAKVWNIFRTARGISGAHGEGN